jgi:hypothetical protein
VSETSNLKPCPFCGGQVQLERAHVRRDLIHGERQFWGVVCRNTANVGGSCCMEQVPSASKEAAIGRWNMRAPSGEDDKRRLDALEAAKGDWGDCWCVMRLDDGSPYIRPWRWAHGDFPSYTTLRIAIDAALKDQ